MMMTNETHLMTNGHEFSSFDPMFMIFVSTCSCEKGEKCEKDGIKFRVILTILESNMMAESLFLF